MDRYFCLFVFAAIIKKQLGIKVELYTILQILSVTIMEKTPIIQVLSQFNESEKTLDDSKQLILFK